ncbi:hypothetical protein [Roseospirillum parvum]|uniref:Structural protein P5 n=1 Tax=Roseospirillum parvum TaxID=83401 RepID=A0A1G8GGW3_9PROT|nr:hypothetical protein [Roseospirillum parvum]SDH93605.1 hypothetical protein SAMN05421742_1277 [Roseospirillum parvum]
MSLPRGIRNHNPGNIELGAPWEGLAAEQTDGRFCQFTSPKWGIRAIARILITYADQRRAADGSPIDTVAEVVARWAPPVENDTGAYTRHVAARLGVGPDQIIEIKRAEVMRGLIRAIIAHENGPRFADYYSDAEIDQGMRLAGVDVPPKPLAKSRTIRAGAATTAATGLAGLAEVADQLAPLSGLAAQIAGAAPVVLVILVLVGVGYMVWCRIDDQRTEARP